MSKLAKHDAGSLFDLRHDSADDIALAIVGNLSAHKVKTLADGILAGLKKSRSLPGEAPCSAEKNPAAN
jgi:hypothetical protein